MVNRLRLALMIMLLLVALPIVTHAQQDATAINYGDTVTGQMRSSDARVWYVFSGTKGDIVTITAQSENADVWLQLGDADVNLLQENDDISTNDTNASISEFELPASGDYYIVVGTYSKGRFTLSLQSTSAQPDVVEIAYGDSQEGQAINIKTPVLYVFNGEAGQTVTVTMESDKVDTYLVLADANGDTLADSDDISNDNTNSQIEAVLPAAGSYIIGAFAYSAGPYTLSLAQGGTNNDGGGTVTVSNNEGGNTYTGEISNKEYFQTYPIGQVSEGSTITIETRKTSGDLDLYVGLMLNDEVVAENDDRDNNTTDAALEFPGTAAGDYSVVVTRYGFEQGETKGKFEASIKVSTGSTSIATGGTDVTVNPVANGYPAVRPTANIADWTVLVYLGGDNNLEDGLINDLDEFERAGGSTESVRIVALLDRADGYDRSNGNWKDTRIFEPGRDTTRDYRTTYPPTIDSRTLADLGELDTGYGNNLLDFLVWGVTAYPAQHYMVILNDHGGAWQGTVSDETSDNSMLGIPDLTQAFRAALKNTGRDKFDVLVNDACLMSGMEAFTAMSDFFNYALSSPEITFNPSFDMEALTIALNKNPDISMADLGKIMVDRYLEDMNAVSPDQATVLGAAMTDLRKMPNTIAAIDNFAAIVAQNPKAYTSLLGQSRSNSYQYSFFLPPEEANSFSAIDIGSFMTNIVNNTNDKKLKSAAQDVLDSLDALRLYGNAGSQLKRYSSYYNIYFPEQSSNFYPGYFQISPLTSWSTMLRAYFTGVSASPRSRAAVSGSGAASTVVAAPSAVPQVSVTNLYPSEGSILQPFQVSMEVMGRNLSEGRFTVDWIAPDGTLVRVDSSTIVTTVTNADGTVEYVNRWTPGVDEKVFTWDVQLYSLNDGTNSNIELLNYTQDITSISGRYQYPDSTDWVDVTVLFAEDRTVSSVLGQQGGDGAVGGIRLEDGGKFQTYYSVVTPDGRVVQQEGNTYNWSNNLSYSPVPAPSGTYQLGFQVEAFGGATGFDSVQVKVNNDKVNPEHKGYMDIDWGFNFELPKSWSDVVYFKERDYIETNNIPGDQFIYIYPAYKTGNDLEAIAQTVIDKYNFKTNGRPRKMDLNGTDALGFQFSYTINKKDYVGRAVAVYIESLDIGLIFSVEAVGSEIPEDIFTLMTDSLNFFDATKVKAKDTGMWKRDHYTGETHYPVRVTWMPGEEHDNGWWYYNPDNDPKSSTFAAVEVYYDIDDVVKLLEGQLEKNVTDQRRYSETGRETYYGELNTWEQINYTYRNKAGETIIGRIYGTQKNGGVYMLWFEAPEDSFNDTMRDYFAPMLDGFRIDEKQ